MLLLMSRWLPGFSRQFFFSWKWSLFIFREIPGKSGSYSMFFNFSRQNYRWDWYLWFPNTYLASHSTAQRSWLRGQFFTLNVDKDRHFLPPSPLHLVHVVNEWPLTQKYCIFYDVITWRFSVTSKEENSKMPLSYFCSLY